MRCFALMTTEAESKGNWAVEALLRAIAVYMIHEKGFGTTLKCKQGILTGQETGTSLCNCFHFAIALPWLGLEAFAMIKKD